MITACIISFVIGALIMMCAIGLMSCQKDKKPRNKVRFFICRVSIDRFILTVQNKNGYCVLSHYVLFQGWNLNKKDFEDLKIGERKELILNLED